MEGVKFIAFPKLKKEPELCEKWVRVCGRKGFTSARVTKDTYICSLHFVGARCIQTQYQRHIQFNRWGISTLLIIYSPSVVFFVMTVSSLKGRVECGNARTFIIEPIAKLLLFPALAIYRYGERLFWSIDALYRQDSAREEALDKANNPSRIELYLFLHAFLHAAPQATLQLYVILNQHGQKILINATQIFCVASSLVSLSITLASFQRFESQRLAGRTENWVIPPCTLDETPKGIASHEARDNEEGASTFNPPKISVLPPSPTLSLLGQADACNGETRQTESCPTSTGNEPRPTTPALTNQRVSVKGLERDDPLGMCVSFFWWMFFLLSRALALVTFSQFFPGATAAVCVAHCVAATAYLLTISRPPSISTTLQQICLGVAFLFCFIEYKTKFNHVKVLYATYFLTVFFENIAVSLVWCLADDLWGVSWYKYTFLLVFGSYIASMLAMGLYMMFLKPKVTSCYID